MVTVCCCQCDPRLACYGVAVLSFFHFLVESILLYMLDNEHRLVDEDKGVKFLTVFITNLFLMLASILLFFAAYYLIRALCIPWMIGCAFHILIYISILVINVLQFFDDFEVIDIEKFFFTLFQLFTVIYGMWLVTTFMMELKEDGESLRTYATRSMFKMYSEDETVKMDEEGELFPKPSRRSKRGSATGRKQDKMPLLAK